MYLLYITIISVKSLNEVFDYQNDSGKYAAITASITDGSIFATRIVFPQTRFTPTQKINTEPISDKYAVARSVITGATSLASKVIAPSTANTGIAENAQPFPSEEVITAIMMKSSTDFTASVEKSPEMPS